MKSEGAGELRESLFGRLAKAKVEAFILDKQYRMHPQRTIFPFFSCSFSLLLIFVFSFYCSFFSYSLVSLFPCWNFYGGKIQDAVEAKDRPLPKGFNWTKGKPEVMINVKGREVSLESTIFHRLFFSPFHLIDFPTDFHLFYLIFFL